MVCGFVGAKVLLGHWWTGDPKEYLTVTLWDLDPSLRGLAERQGFRLDASGGAEISIRGTATSPQIDFR